MDLRCNVVDSDKLDCDLWPYIQRLVHMLQHMDFHIFGLYKPYLLDTLSLLRIPDDNQEEALCNSAYKSTRLVCLLLDIGYSDHKVMVDKRRQVFLNFL